MKMGNEFIFEHPVRATSWSTNNSVKQMLAKEGVMTCTFDQCAMGLKDCKGNAMKKRTRLMTNSHVVMQNFGNRYCKCPKNTHTQIQGSQDGVVLSKHAQRYTPEMFFRFAMSAADIVIP